jgi:hypothetical protein
MDKNTHWNLAIASNGAAVCALSVGEYIITIVNCVIATCSTDAHPRIKKRRGRPVNPNHPFPFLYKRIDKPHPAFTC